MLTGIRHAIRALWRDRTFSAMVVASLALGIGANTAIFSILNAVLLRPLALPNHGRLVAITQSARAFLNGVDLPTNLGILFEWRKRASSLESIGVYQPSGGTLTGEGDPEQIGGIAISSNMLQVLGVKPRLGRLFAEGEDADGRDSVVILSDSLWQRRFQSDPNIVGKKIVLSDTPRIVVGVLPADFQFPLASTQWSFAPASRHGWEFFRPLGYNAERARMQMSDFNFWVIARLRPGVNIPTASAELNVVESAISAQFPENPGLVAKITPLEESMVADVRRGLVLLMCAVGAVLLVLWVNLANLSLVRAGSRVRDSVIRTALGAGWTRLAGQSLLESALLSLTGAIAGVLAAWWGLPLLLRAAPADLPRISEIHLDTPVLLFALAASFATTMILGIIPALRLGRGERFEVLKSGSRTATVDRAGLRARNAFIVAETGLSAALLITAGLLIGSFARLMHVNKGFDEKKVIAADLAASPVKYKEDRDRAAFFKRVVEQAQKLPGIESAAIVSALPLTGETWIDIIGTENETRPSAQLPTANLRFISPGYFRTLRIPLLEGRDFEDRDGDRKTAIISESLAHKLWPDQDPIGRKLRDVGQLWEVIGVTPDIHSTSLDKQPVHMLYIPNSLRPAYRASLLVRGAVDPHGIANTLRRMIWDIDSTVPVPQVRSLEEVMDRSQSQRQFQAMLVLLFAAAALALAAFGTYGVASWVVERRRIEMGIRMALGAERAAVLKLVLWQGLRPVVAGLIAGGLAALAIGKYIASLLFEVSPRDPRAFTAAIAVLISASLAACWIPALRATRVDPVEALRFE